MSVLLDTNILLRLAQPSHRQHMLASASIVALKRSNQPIYVVPQNLYELWAVATRPSGPANGLGLSVPAAEQELERVHSLFSMIHDSPAVYAQWSNLVKRHDVKGKVSHDARLVAAMIAHGIDKILPFNDGDFVRFTEITVLTPAQITAVP